MKKELDYFTIEGCYGGNQDWFTNLVMHMGGCAAATACDSCIYFGLQNEKMKPLYPFDIECLTKEDYKAFSQIMKPYLKPRAGGVRKLSWFVDGLGRYIQDQNEAYKDYIWHWFLLTGYEEKDEKMYIKTATYGESDTFELEDFWNTGCEEKGGLIRLTPHYN